MSERKKIQGQVIGFNSLQYDGRIVQCWENAVDDPSVPKECDLFEHASKDNVVEVSGHLCTDLWEAKFERVVNEGGYDRIKGVVLDEKTIEEPGGPITCYRYGPEGEHRTEGEQPLYFEKYRGRKVTVMGELRDRSLYRAQIVEVPELVIGDRDQKKEAKSQNDLLRIRARKETKDLIEEVNGNLGTALGYKRHLGKLTLHPCIIIFVPEENLERLAEIEEQLEILEDDKGTWCFTELFIVEEFDTELSTDLSPSNHEVKKKLCSTRDNIELIGGIQLKYYEDGVEKEGTAGISVQHRVNKKIGFLTNHHVISNKKYGCEIDDEREFYQGDFEGDPIGKAYCPDESCKKNKENEEESKSSKECPRKYCKFKEWYRIGDDDGFKVRCDYGFVEIYESDRVLPGLYKIGNVGSVDKIDLNSMDIIGKKIISVGSQSGIQRGTVAALSYEWSDDGEEESYYTDLLIIGEQEGVFSTDGDSGKIIVTDTKEHHPIGLHWGGDEVSLPNDKGNNYPQVCGYAVNLKEVLKRLNLEIYRKKSKITEEKNDV